MKNQITYLLLTIFLWNGFCMNAQSLQTGPADPVAIAREYIKAHLSDWGLTPGDVAEMTVNDLYTDQKTGITRVYFLQRHQGIPVSQAILNINIDKTGKVFFAGNRFESDIETRINTTIPTLNPSGAVIRLADHLGIVAEEPRTKTSAKESQYQFDKGNMASEDITVALTYQPYEGNLRLAWDVLISPLHTNDKWSTRIDAITGDVLVENNWTLYCHGNNMSSHEDYNPCLEQTLSFNSCSPVDTNEPVYNIWPPPFESPRHVPRTISPAIIDTLASPYGWHDIDGQPGPEYTITKGNNVHAYQDQDGDLLSSNDEPDGGPEMIFDFPFDPSWEPGQYVEASVVNAFYWVNYMHDFSYHFGFDEEAGNFQNNNYGKGGIGNDAIKVLAQQGMDTGKFNNGYYNHGLEGEPSRMSINIFRDNKYFLEVIEPSSLAGRWRTSLPSQGWGAGTYITDIPLTGEVVFVNDGIEALYTTDACEEIINASELAGKIAFIDRGGCEFGWKALQAQNAGAIGVLIADFEEDNFTLNPGAYGASVHIPILMVHLSDCQAIRPFVNQGLRVTLVDPGDNSPHALDGDLDNSLLIHEYGHGISNRIVGGPNSYCLNNEEQMGEGWSDFLFLAITALPGDTGEKKRGFATYAVRDELDGKGYRRFPYSTDMNIMPLTYSDVAAAYEVHNLGEVWAATLWDMYWALVDKYGWSENLYDELSGNYRAIKLVMDGLKNTPCSPGFIDGRNAILAADSSLYNGEDAELIWKVFARRGIGYSADQGSPHVGGDQVEAFDLPPIYTGKIVIEKSVTDFIQPGDSVHVTITVGNFKTEPVTNVEVSDIIPEGITFKVGSANLPVDQQGDLLSFQLGDMDFKEEITISYTLETDPGAWSKRIFLDEISDENNTYWHTYTEGGAPNTWNITNDFPAHSGSFSWNTKEVKEKSRQVLELKPEEFVFHVQGERPTLRFYHRLITKAAMSGGLVEVKEVNSNKWLQVGDNMLRNGYFGPVDYLTFLAPNFIAFSGYSGNTFKDTYVDLSPWSGKDILIRFRFGTNLNSNTGLGWFIDDIEFMNLLAYNSEVCVSTDQGDFECAIAPESGTIVDTKEGTVSTSQPLEKLHAIVYPNPAKDIITVQVFMEHEAQVNASLLSVDGKEMLRKTFNTSANGRMIIDASYIPEGLYFIHVMTEEGHYVEKVIIQK